MSEHVETDALSDRIARYLKRDGTVFGAPKLDGSEIDGLRRFVSKVGRGEPALELGRAMRILIANDRSDAAAVAVGQVLADTDAELSVRTQAAASLGRLPGGAATNGLIFALPEAPARVQVAILTALARAGTKDALPVLNRLEVPEKSRLADIRDFAVTMIAVRSGTAIPKSVRDTVLPQGAQLKIRPESAKVARGAIDAMTEAGFDTPLSEKRAICYKCGDAKHIVLFSEALSDKNAGEVLRRQGMIAGIIAREDRAAHRFVARYLVVTHPEKTRTLVSLVTPNGDVAFLGALEPDADGQELRLSDYIGTRISTDVKGRLTAEGTFSLDIVSHESRARDKKTGEAIREFEQQPQDN